VGIMSVVNGFRTWRVQRRRDRELAEREREQWAAQADPAKGLEKVAKDLRWTGM
jgi:hypothetical protein